MIETVDDLLTKFFSSSAILGAKEKKKLFQHLQQNRTAEAEAAAHKVMLIAGKSRHLLGRTLGRQLSSPVTS